MPNLKCFWVPLLILFMFPVSPLLPSNNEHFMSGIYTVGPVVLPRVVIMQIYSSSFSWNVVKLLIFSNPDLLKKIRLGATVVKWATVVQDLLNFCPKFMKHEAGVSWLEIAFWSNKDLFSRCSAVFWVLLSRILEPATVSKIHQFSRTRNKQQHQHKACQFR